MAFKLKRDANNAVVVNDKDLPIFINDEDNNAELAFDPDEARKTTARLKSEAAATRVELGKAQENLKAFDGIDPKIYAENAEIASKVKDKKMIDSGEADRLRADITKQYDEKLAKEKEENSTLRSSWDNEKVTNAFLGSKFIAEKVGVPTDVLQSYLGNRFKVVDGKIRAFNPDGSAVVSKVRIGEEANFEEAVEIFVTTHPQSAALLKSGQKSGGGSNAGGGGGGGKDAKEMKRSEYGKLSPAEQREFTVVKRGKIIPD